MGGIAVLARELGYEVTGSDRNVYPPMSTQLRALGIELTEGYGAEQLTLDPDLLIVGNVMTRGMPVIEAMLDRGLARASGPEWLADALLRQRWVIAIAGTHGKTTTTSMVAWILEYAGLAPGFLIGGVPQNFGVSARVGSGSLFVIEADEYDTAFFDKRAKFLHYGPRTLVLNNLEYDHADIYPDLASIERQFQHLVRTVPASGRILCHTAEPALSRVLAGGCWTPVETYGRSEEAQPVDFRARARAEGDFSCFEVLHRGRPCGEVRWNLMGVHNADNALAALSAARHAGVPLECGIEALSRFEGVARRMQLLGEVAGIRVYDDFAHHPSAIATTLEGLRRREPGARIVAVLEPRSATMRLGVHRSTLADSLSIADAVHLYAPPDLGWDAAAAVASLGVRAQVSADLETLVATLVRSLRAGDHVVIMSNGGFGGLHRRLLDALGEQRSDAADAPAERSGRRA